MITHDRKWYNKGLLRALDLPGWSVSLCFPSPVTSNPWWHDQCQWSSAFVISCSIEGEGIVGDQGFFWNLDRGCFGSEGFVTISGSPWFSWCSYSNVGFIPLISIPILPAALVSTPINTSSPLSLGREKDGESHREKSRKKLKVIWCLVYWDPGGSGLAFELCISFCGDFLFPLLSLPLCDFTFKLIYTLSFGGVLVLFCF